MASQEIIMRTERRRKWSEAERGRILAECAEAGASVAKVARKYDVSPSVIYGWRKKQRDMDTADRGKMDFIACGELGEVDSAHLTPPHFATGQGHSAKMAEGAQPNLQPPQHFNHFQPNDRFRDRQGTIEIYSKRGDCLVVDSFVNEKALNRVLRCLRDVS